MCFNCIICYTKIDRESVYQVSCFPAKSYQPFLKKIKVISIEHLKQKLNLGNNIRRCYNGVFKSKIVMFSLCRHVYFG